MRARAAGAMVLLLVVGLAGCTLPEGSTAPPPSYEAPMALQWAWEEAAPLPAPVHHAACTAYRDDVWVLGGLDRNGLVTGQVQRWNPEADAWERTGGLARPVHQGTAVVVAGDLQVAGGYPDAFRTEPTDRVQERSAFDFFVEAGTLPGPLAEADTATLGGRPLLAGGTPDGATASARILAWDDLQGWDPIEGSLATGRAGLGLGAWNDTLLVAAGGWSLDGMTYGAEAQTLNGAQVVTLPDVPTPRTGAASAATADHLFLFGGRDAQDEVSTASEYLDLQQSQWLRTPPLPVAIADACAVALPDGIHVLGGVDKQGDVLATHLVLRERL